MVRGKKVGLLISASPQHANFEHGLRLAEAALLAGADVYFYCIDEAVLGLTHSLLEGLKARGVKLFACAYSAQRRKIILKEQALFSGLTILSDLLAGTDRFVVFN